MSFRSCPICRSKEVNFEQPTEYRYDNCGLSRIILLGQGVVVARCASCGNTSTRIRNEPQLLQYLGMILLMNPPGMKGEELRYMRTLLGMTQAELAKVLRTPRRETVAEWEKKGRIWDRPLDEVGPRAGLLALYETRIVQSDSCFLADRHKSILERYTCSFVRVIFERMGTKRSNDAVSITHRPRKREWEARPVLVPA